VLSHKKYIISTKHQYFKLPLSPNTADIVSTPGSPSAPLAWTHTVDRPNLISS